MKKIYAFQSNANANYHKALERLEKNLRSGRFAQYSQDRKRQLWNRLCRYAQQLGIKVKASLVAACIAAGLIFAGSAEAQTFVKRTGLADPFDGVNVGFNPAPVFVDIDGDGDKDAFIGEYFGTVLYYKNTGTQAAPVFSKQDGAANPLNGIDFGVYISPTFVDIDNDGDMDLFVGEAYGDIYYYKNTGTPTSPVFTEQTGAANPFNNALLGYVPSPTFVDIDGDGDKDVFVGDNQGNISYFKNTGSATSPVFTPQTGSSNPLDGISGYNYVSPTFADLDKDGDLDAFIGEYGGGILYYKNTGTANAPAFTLQTGNADPFNGETVGFNSKPAFVDIDGDGDLDLFIGEYYGTLVYYENTTILPLHLLNFNGTKQAGYNQLEWRTANELNTRLFEIERSSDGSNFIKIASVSAAGTGNQNYTLRDDATFSGRVYYRIKMIDMDGKFTYSAIIFINNGQMEEITIYPNPVRNSLNLHIGKERLLKTNAAIYDVNGKLVQRILLSTYQVQVNAEALPKGMYYIKFADGSARNFIKE